MEKVTVARVYQDKVETKYGIRDKVSIYANEYPDVKMSSFDKGAVGIKVGDVVDVTIEKNGQFTNFKMGSGKSTSKFGGSSDLEGRVKKLEDKVFGAVDTKQSDVVEDTTSDFDSF